VPLILAALVLIIDIASKYWTQATLPLMTQSLPWYPYGGVPVFKNFLGIEFSISHATNKGAAWGAFSDYSFFLLLMRLLLIAVLLLYYYRAERAYRYALALIIAGALGNVLDIFFYGHVVDMFHFVLWGYQYPVFNVADSSIFCGVLLYIVLSWKQNYAGNKVA
jgi:signal peptidase II